ncbi:MAG TPA: glycerol-3-phosphate acyltransferase, partial [Thermosynergistes sp.]|nr:glycerol-3-phosphate acyltransferase [Thermosynergistes sp.]
LVGVASVCGHVFPLWLKFRGGKGVATTFGVVFSYHPLVALASGALWWILVRLFRYVSLASMISLSCAPFFFWLLGADRVYVFASASLAALTIARHKDNIERLLSGTENRVGRPTKGP